MNPEQLKLYLATLSPRDMIHNLDYVSGLARRIRLKQAVGSQEDELALCRMMLDLKFLTELIEVVKVEVDGINGLRETYERMLKKKDDEIQKLKSSAD
jgi:hypothetical protein